jgi:hypothetical protein
MPDRGEVLWLLFVGSGSIPRTAVVGADEYGADAERGDAPGLYSDLHKY